ncbi:MAG: trypsin-like peptidase domain-containing protein [Flavobacteriales bacterium]|nr:trypsin-like peptidase domain-containing protein [Flavobacteriales bacterium]
MIQTIHRFRICVPFLALIPLGSVAQVSQGGVPLSISRAHSLPVPQGFRLPQVDLVALAAEDAVNDLDKSIPYRFGFNHTVDLDLNNSGTWTTLEEGTRVWRLGLECPSAISVNFEFHDFEIPVGAKVFVLNETGDHLGAFTHANDQGDHVLGIQPIRGARITIEYQVPAGAPNGRLRIGQVTHGYRDIFSYGRGLGTSGACNNNVICPEGDPWRDQIRSVAMIVVGGGGICTGTLINNCAQDGTPYFLTANHCLPGNLNVSTWVFRFNWDSPVCGANQNGPTTQTVSGATLLANSGNTDVALLQLNSTPPSNYNVYYSGWDRSGVFPTSQTAIHHPDGDIKKISFDNQAAGQGVYGSAQCWRIFNWEDGTTEPGSSGSGLWDQNKRLIGQLYGGQATCANNVNDYYGRFDLSYGLLQQWLGNCGNTIDGYDPNAPSLALDAQVVGATGLPANSCSATVTPSITVRNGGVNTLTSFTLSWSLGTGGNGTQNWTGSLTSGQTVSVALGGLTLSPGTNLLTAVVSNPNGGVDLQPANDQGQYSSIHGNNTVTLNLTLDRYGAETTWVIRNGGTVLASGGPYTTVGANGAYPQAPIAVCVPDGCHELVVFDSFGDGMCCAYGNGGYTLTDAQGTVLASGGSFTSSSTSGFCVTSGIQVAPRVFLGGAYGTGPLMSDALRVGGLVPLLEPYSGLGFTHVGGGGEQTTAPLLAQTGTNAIVDWVLVELRNASSPYALVATRAALLQADGDVVDAGGVPYLTFSQPAGNYRVAVRHRNHLGAMSSSVGLSAAVTTVDLTSPATATYGTNAQRAVGPVNVLWSGNVLRDGRLSYSGSGNDRDPILSRIGGAVPTATTTGYLSEDVNMDGVVKYSGASNDRDPILNNIGGVVPTATVLEQMP